MDFKFGKQWIEDRKHVTELIQRLFGNSSRAQNYLKRYKKGDILLEEGQKLDHIYILLEGVVELYKKKPDVDADYPIMRLQSGSFIVIIAFTTVEPSLTTSKVMKTFFKEASSPQLRMLAQLPDHMVELLQKSGIDQKDSLKFYLHHFELGQMFRNIDSAGNRIAGLVKSLKSYSRTDTESMWEEIDIREGIHDTLQLTCRQIKNLSNSGTVKPV